MLARQIRRRRNGLPTWRPLAVLTGAMIAAIAVFLALWCNPEDVDAEARFDGVHMCSPKKVREDARATATAAAALVSQTSTPRSQGSPTTTLTATSTVAATVTDTPLPGDQAASPPTATPTPTDATATATSTPTAGADGQTLSVEQVLRNTDGSVSPFFSQNHPNWGSEEYDHSKALYNGCPGPTIAQCGCAMTSLGNAMAMYGLVTTPDGVPLTPKTLNEWFSADAVLTQSGWASRGFIAGNVNWMAAAEFSADASEWAAQANADADRLPTVRYAHHGDGSVETIAADLDLGRFVVLHVPGHWIAAVGYSDDRREILIKDPYYADRIYLSQYEGRIIESVHFEPSSDLSGIVVTVPAHLRILITDRDGNTIGTLTAGTPEDAERIANATNQIQGAQYVFEEAWRDPTCVESPPGEEDGTTSVYFPAGTELDDLTIEVENPDGGGTTTIVHEYDENGNSEIYTEDTPDPRHVFGSGTPTPTPTPTQRTSLVSPTTHEPDPDTPTPAPTMLIPPVTLEPPTPDPSAVPPTVVPTPPPPPPPVTGFDAACGNRFFALNNEYRVANGLAPLNYDARLERAAQHHASFVLETEWWWEHPGSAIHHDAAGLDHTARAIDLYGYFPYAYVGENVTWGDLALSLDELFYERLIKAASREDPADTDWVNLGVACKTGAYRVIVMVYGGSE
jgi:uncharacterized protein YkwD